MMRCLVLTLWGLAPAFVWSYHVSSLLRRSRAIPAAAPRSRGSFRRAGPSMMFDGISGRVSDALQRINGVQRISEASVAGALKDVKRALLDSDVNLAVANALVAGVTKRAIGVKVLDGVTAEQQFVKLIYDELVELMGGEGSSALAGGDRGVDGRPQVVLMAGLQGAGKTTSAGKLALTIVTDPKTGEPTGRGCVLAAADVYRPAAIAQLQTLGAQVDVPVFSLGPEASPVDIATGAVKLAEDLQKSTGKPFTVIVDTAGRQVIDGPLMEELAAIKAAVVPDEVLLVVDAMTGQEAATLTERFNGEVGITGAVLTKLDGDTRGGAAISVRAVSGCPIKLVGVGEKMAPLEPFYPERLASRILGMGDVVSLVEKAQKELSEAEAIASMKKMQDATFDFNDFMQQNKMVASMGGAAQMMSMLPGMGGGIDKKQIAEAEVKMKRYEAFIQSMTKGERANPQLFITDKSARSRAMRIAKGSGRSLDEATVFLAEFQQMRTMMSRMSKMAGGGDDFDELAAADMGGMGGAGLPPPPSAAGNRAARRAGKKGAAKRKGGPGGFGKK